MQHKDLGGVTIATNMTGHGIDIILGGNAEFMARLKPCEMLLHQFIHCTESMGSFGRHGAVFLYGPSLS